MSQTVGVHEIAATNLDELASTMLATYARDCGVNRRGTSSIPSAREIEKLVQDLLIVLFPGYLGDLPVSDSGTKEYLTRALVSFKKRLKKVIERSVNYGCKYPDKYSAAAHDIKADEVANHLLGNLPKIRSQLTRDIQAAYSGDPAAKSYEEIIACYPSLLAISIHRVAHELYEDWVPLVPRMMSEYAHRITGIDIHPGAKIGLNFFIDHGTGTVIGETAEIGNNVRLYQGVTIGALSVPRESRRLSGVKRHPTIEDDVIIYAGATILGGDTVIGKGSVIGGNVWITSSVQPNAKVALAPTRLLA